MPMKIDGINWIFVIIITLLLAAFVLLAVYRLPGFKVINIIN